MVSLLRLLPSLTSARRFGGNWEKQPSEPPRPSTMSAQVRKTVGRLRLRLSEEGDQTLCFDASSALCRHCGVHHGRAAQLLLHGDEHAAAGGTSRLGDDHWNRPGGVAAQGEEEEKEER